MAGFSLLRGPRRGRWRALAVYLCILGMARSLAAATDQSKAEAAKMRAARLALHDDLPVIPFTGPMLTAARDLRMNNWAYSNAGDLNEYSTPQAAADRAAELRKSKATVAIVRGRHFRLDFLHETDRIMKYYQTAAEAIHDQGLVCVAHFDYAITWQPGFATLKSNFQWPQRSLHDGTPTRWLCVNNPTLREQYIQYIEEIVRRGVDGFMLDEIQFIFKSHLHCGCEHCRNLFEAKTGYRLPETDDRAVIGNPNSPLWRLFQEWQAYSLTRFRADMLTRLHKINPDVFIMTYSTNIYGVSRAASSVFEEARVCFAGSEGSDLSFGGAAYLYAQHRTMRAFTDFWGKPTWAQYPAPTEEGRIFASVFLAPVTGNGPWGWTQACTWPGLEEAFTFAAPLADLAVLLAPSNRFGPVQRAAAHHAEAFGWMQGLGLRGVQFNPVVGKYATPDLLKGYRAVLVPDCVRMSASGVDAVDRFVRNGGTALVTGVPGRDDVLGHPHGETALHRRMGLHDVLDIDGVYFHYKKQCFQNGVQRTVTLEPGIAPSLPREVTLQRTYRFDVVSEEDVAVKTLARFDDGTPAVREIPAGKGRYLYVGFLPGQVAYQARCSQATLVEDCLHPAAMDLIRGLAREATAKSDRVLVDGPEVLSSTWCKGNRVWVRMVNVGGLRRLPPGKRIGKDAPTYPPLEVIRLRLRLSVTEHAVLLSPDRAGPVTLPVTIRDGERIVEIPAKTFEKFAVVRLEVTP